MRVGINSQGYTIMEVMIFLAVSGFMFVIAAGMISGKQQKAEFRQGMNTVAQQMQTVINDVNNGFFPANTTNFSCTTNDTGGQPVLGPPVAGSTTQGTKKGCVFMGKVYMFGDSVEPGRGYSILTMAGRQYKTSAASGMVPTNFTEAKPIAVTGSPFYELTDSGKFQGGMTLIKAFSGTSTNTLNGIGFYSSFGSYDSGGTLESGSQDVTVIGINGSSGFDDSVPQMATNANGQSTDGNVIPNPDIIMCFSGGNNQYGTLEIGGTGGQRLATHIQVYNDIPDFCS